MNFKVGFLLSIAAMMDVLLVQCRTKQDAEVSTPTLQIKVIEENLPEIQIHWNITARVRHTLTECWLHYGPLTGALHVQTQVDTSESVISLKDLEALETYYAFLSCQHGSKRLPSNALHFTPHETRQPESVTSKTVPKNTFKKMEPPKVKSLKTPLYEQHLEPRQEPLHHNRAFIQSSSSSSRWPAGDGLIPVVKNQQSDEGILIHMKERHMNRARRDPHSSSPPTRLVLGAICGVVGFLIINITIVFAVRQYSEKRARRRRMVELQLQQNGGYVYNLADLINA